MPVFAEISRETTIERALVVGLAVTGRAVVDSFLRRGISVVAIDDDPSEAAIIAAADRGLDLVVAPDEDQLGRLIKSVDIVVPSPGVPRHHLAYELADSAMVPVVSEFDLAALWDDRPSIAITGTNGKTTVTTLVAAMLKRSGRPALCAGNIDVPLIEAVDRTDDTPPTWFVVEASSFRLERVSLFAPRVAAWLNLAPDHLDWHGNMDAYAEAKARIWRNHTADDVKVIPTGAGAVGAAPIAVHAARAKGRTVTFGSDVGDVRVSDGVLVAEPSFIASSSERAPIQIVTVAELPRRLPHDLLNAAAASACALSVGVDVDSVREELLRFEGLPHRMSLVGVVDGIECFDDSKATTPEATVAALSGFDSAVLIAGGRNKGLDLSMLGDLIPHLSGVVAIGESASLIQDAYRTRAAATDGVLRVVTADSMSEAVDRAFDLASGSNRRADAIVLSPACASFDWYLNYAERGDDFARCVEQLTSPDRTSPDRTSPDRTSPDRTSMENQQ